MNTATASQLPFDPPELSDFDGPTILRVVPATEPTPTERLAIVHRLVTDVFGTALDLDPVAVRAGAQEQNALIVSADTVAHGLLTISPELQERTLASLAAAGIDVSAEDLFDLSLLDEVYAEFPELADLGS